jgi:hypothetical protein
VLRGEFAGNGRPYIRGELWIPRFNLRHDIRFCVDTGSGYTVLMPDDGLAIGVDYVKLDDEIDLATVGGATSTFLEPVEISFTDFDARAAYSYRAVLAIAPPSAETAAVPSLLGRDVINRWRIDYHPTAGQLLCDVITADEVIQLPAP